MGKGKNLLKVIIRISPKGLNCPANVYFTNKNVPMQKLYDFSRGEGNVLCFTLSHSDLFPEFAKALKEGTVAEELEKGVHKLHFDIAGMRRDENDGVCQRCGESDKQHSPGCPEASTYYRAEWEKRAEKHWPEEQFLMWERQQEKYNE